MNTRQTLVVGTILTLAHLLSGCGGGNSGSSSIPAGKIAYESVRSGVSSIRIVNSDGSNDAGLASSGSQPAFSRDGSKVAFINTSDYPDQINLINIDGSGHTVLDSPTQYCQHPSFSPDGSRIVAARGGDGGFDICVKNLNGDSTAYIGTINHDDLTPSFSPDGTKIIFSSNRNGDQFFDIADYEIYMMNLNGSGIQRMTDNTTDDSSPSFNANGTKIVFASNRSGNNEIYIMDSQGHRQTRLTSTPGHNNTEPSFSDDGRKIAFTSDRDGNKEIYVMNSDGSNQTRITFNPEDDIHPSFVGR